VEKYIRNTNCFS